MKRYPKDPMKEAAESINEEPQELFGEVDLEDLLDKGKEVLRREVHNLLKMSLNGKLKAREAEHLTAYVRLLHTLTKDEKENARKIADNESK